MTLVAPKGLFISNTGSNDNAGTISAPVLPSYLNTYTFSGNEKILFNRGETFDITQTITVDQPGVFFGAYGSGADPILRGSEAIAGWTDNLDGTFSITASEPNWLFSGGSIMKMAQTGWIATTGSTAVNKLSINHASVSGYSDIVGSYLVYKARNWTAQRYKVTAYDGAGVITLDANLSLSYEAGGSIKLRGKSDYFSANNEWAYEGGDIIVKAASEPTARKSTFSSMFDIQADSVRIDNLVIQECYEGGISRTSGNGLTVTNCTIKNIVGSGVRLLGYEQLATITDNEIYNCFASGITSLTTVVCDVFRNTIYNIGTQDNLWSASTGISITMPAGQLTNYPNGSTVKYNTIYNCAYSCINIRGKNNVVSYNHLYNAMLNFNDGGAVYTFGGNPNSVVVNAENNTYSYNTIHDVVGSVDGSLGNIIVYGIYLDNETFNATVTNNVVYNCKTGMRINRGTRQHTITGNIIHDNSSSQFKFVTGYAGTDYPINDGNTFNDNILSCTKNDQYCFYSEILEADPDYNPYDNGGEADRNYYIQPYTADVAYDTNAGGRTLAELRTLYGQDVNSTSKTNWITPPGTPATDLILYTNPTSVAVNQVIPSGYEDIDGTDISGTTQSIPAYYGLLIIKT